MAAQPVLKFLLQLVMPSLFFSALLVGNFCQLKKIEKSDPLILSLLLNKYNCTIFPCIQALFELSYFILDFAELF